jgi:hypothetical protein
MYNYIICLRLFAYCLRIYCLYITNIGNLINKQHRNCSFAASNPGNGYFGAKRSEIWGKWAVLKNIYTVMIYGEVG